jgi:hypothetical protein
VDEAALVKTKLGTTQTVKDWGVVNLSKIDSISDRHDDYHFIGICREEQHGVCMGLAVEKR